MVDRLSTFVEAGVKLVIQNASVVQTGAELWSPVDLAMAFGKYFNWVCVERCVL